jgi:hypothetical protein
MLTLFSTAKPFVGHSNIIQRNALKSWTLLHPNAEVILFGDELGAAEVCRDLGIRHEPQVLRNEHGTKYLNYIFDKACDLSRHKFLCYANCDIMLMPDFLVGLDLVVKAHSEFLMNGRRWDIDIAELWDFSQPDWAQKLRLLALLKGKRNSPNTVDYFCFSRDLYYKKMPPFLIGRIFWDTWLTWFARASNTPLIDASKVVVAVHQNHDYAYLGKGPEADRSKAEADYNFSMGGNAGWQYYTVDAATERLVEGRLRPNHLSWVTPIRRRALHYSLHVWWACLIATRPIRHRLGLRRSVASKP